MINTIVATEQTPIFERTIFKHTLNDKGGMNVHVYLFANNIPKEMFRKLLSDMHIKVPYLDGGRGLMLNI